ncbi:hypothetical protein CLF_111747 [Clonorchis sinensis]|uniref:Uncharacterized protein n=1 Tax=Clonorchis sinensis TaxID=79923 RepID=G7YVA0_CLOSI|nr:hypothetical protein CLF_111747 [Clonorchis sinensis]
MEDFIPDIGIQPDYLCADVCNQAVRFFILPSDGRTSLEVSEGRRCPRVSVSPKKGKIGRELSESFQQPYVYVFRMNKARLFRFNWSSDMRLNLQMKLSTIVVLTVPTYVSHSTTARFCQQTDSQDSLVVTADLLTAKQRNNVTSLCTDDVTPNGDEAFATKWPDSVNRTTATYTTLAGSNYLDRKLCSSQCKNLQKPFLLRVIAQMQVSDKLI